MLVNLDYIKKIEKPLALGRADLHIHTNMGDAKPTVEEVLNYVQTKTDLDVIAITEHDSIDAALLAKKLMAKRKYRFELIIGEEISCFEGHVIGLFLNKTIKGDVSVKEAISEIKRQGGIVMMPHPLRHVRINTGLTGNTDGVGFVELLRHKKNIDALEIINSTPTNMPNNLRAIFFNDTIMQRAEVGGSDAHILDSIAMAYTLFEGKSAEDLREAILNCQTRAFNKRWRLIALIKYLFFFLPKSLRLFVNTMAHGRMPKRAQIVNVPKNEYKTILKRINEKTANIFKWKKDHSINSPSTTNLEVSSIEVKSE